jgi:hypothetical protein
MVVVAELVLAEEERLVIDVEGEGTHVPPPPNRPEIKVSLFMYHDDVTYVDSPLRGPEDVYRQAQAHCPDRPQGTLTGFERWLEALDDPPNQEEFVRPVQSRDVTNSIIPVPSIQDLEPGQVVRVLDHNTTKEEWTLLTGMTIHVRHEDRNISRELITMLRHGHRFYRVHMDEYGYVLVNTISMRFR